eukprot:TRINITY_DN67532_c0_g1_i1.p1 TRINITY_DN67532_c0_g1~~TRINITY_DN67532_c0_g1_i1.p1  ORF type:complete len:390 (+),score=46.64 TRINITY_DN67532_c0_g1_i1:94-1263(+)
MTLRCPSRRVTATRMSATSAIEDCTSVPAASFPERLRELHEAAVALKVEFRTLEAEIQGEAERWRAALPWSRPSHPQDLNCGGISCDNCSNGAGDEESSANDWDVLLRTFPPLDIHPIGWYNHWDTRECAVQNAAEWIDVCEKHVRAGEMEIPKIIHQIWIGPEEPPCVWIDTFRIDYLAAHPRWRHELWDDDKVAKLPMLNQRIYDEERMFQCKADILRLEILWRYGGIYIDADIVSIEARSLDPLLEHGSRTGFALAYEPDTPEKMYSLLSNAVIACTPRNPIVLMLMLFLKQTYSEKRHQLEVFAVTGPVMLTKCLADPRMPVSIVDQSLLYPAFHFVRNPDAVNLKLFTNSLMFQYGYTCTGLAGYIRSRNKCRSGKSCSFHCKR